LGFLKTFLELEFTLDDNESEVCGRTFFENYLVADKLLLPEKISELRQ
jgi:hypothetical protein